MVALNRNLKSQITARYAAFWHAIPKSHWPLSFSAPKSRWKKGFPYNHQKHTKRDDWTATAWDQHNRTGTARPRIPVDQLGYSYSAVTGKVSGLFCGVKLDVKIFFEVPEGHHPRGNNPPQGSPRKLASQRVLRGLCRGLFKGSAGSPRGSGGSPGSAGFSEGSDPILVTLGNCWKFGIFAEGHVWDEVSLG